MVGCLCFVLAVHATSIFLGLRLLAADKVNLDLAFDDGGTLQTGGHENYRQRAG